MAAGPESWSDVDLIHAITRSDRQGLACAWHRYSSQVHWVAIAHTNDAENANVALLGAFSDLWAHPIRAARQSSLLAFLVDAARTHCHRNCHEPITSSPHAHTWLDELSVEQLAVAAAFCGRRTHVRDVAPIVALDEFEVARALRTILTKIVPARTR
jgi:hypothetical protein